MDVPKKTLLDYGELGVGGVEAVQSTQRSNTALSLSYYLHRNTINKVMVYKFPTNLQTPH